MGLFGIISNITNGINAVGQGVGYATQAYNWFSGLHLSGAALLIIAGLLIFVGDKIAKGIIYIIAFIMIILALASFGLI